MADEGERRTGTGTDGAAGTDTGTDATTGTTDGETADVAARLAALERENAELRRRLEERPTAVDGGIGAGTGAGGEPPSAVRRPRRRLRAVACAVLITLGALLAPLGAVSAWAQRELTDTDRYVATVGPLAADPVVQSAVAGRLTEEVMSRIDVGALVDDLVGGLEERDVPPRATQALAALEAPLRSGVESLVHETATRLVESDAFEGAWLQANRVAHQQLVAVMRGEDGDILQVDDGRLSIQLSGLIDLLKERLVDRGLGVAARIPSVDATFTIAQSAELVMLQNRYAQIVTLTTWLPWVVLGLLAAGVLVANRRSRALVVAGLALTGAMVGLGIGLAVARGLYLGALSGQVLRLDAAEVVFDQAVGYLRLTLRTVGVLGLVVALAAYLGGPSESARSLRAGLGRMGAAVRGWGEGRGVSAGPVGDWLGRHKAFVRVVVIGAAAVVLLLAGSLTPGLVVGVALVAGLLLVVVEILARPPVVSEPASSS
ncbi:hypothetical protein H1Q78_06340 [Cellulosimicrobium cellulans]|uniref:hypothetical protein n=1 Tax=Cellulosimicrobium cellulans TaxID=1710 RepID=UPI001EDC2579|nr:hypothetical protein [Cellulosimicrobium cellulans]UKJ64978.1 hypothetical protein H1Q78_06340 [Cellulosimicrobium cellulans]